MKRNLIFCFLGLAAPFVATATSFSATAEGLSAAAKSQTLQITDTACSKYIQETWGISGDRLVIANNQIHLCTDACSDPRLYGVDVTNGLVMKFALKKNHFAEVLKTLCTSGHAKKSWPNQCVMDTLDIFKVLIPFTGEPSQICFCKTQDQSPEIALCREVNGKDHLVDELAIKPLRQTLNSACQATEMTGAKEACACSEKNPADRDYVRCLEEISKNPSPDSTGPPDNDRSHSTQ